jgi:hypothetical protein
MVRRWLPIERLESRTVLSGISLVDYEPYSVQDHGEDHDHEHVEVGYHQDAEGNTLHVLPPPGWGPEPASTDFQGATIGDDLTLADTFQLHSNPGASHTIYLDFDGHTTSGTIWNSQFTGGEDIVTPAYSFTGDSSFTDSERSRIQAIWRRVAEDFIPFDVNVTTEAPSLEALQKSGSGDSDWGVRVVIGGSGSWFPQTAGGVAYVGSFNWSSDTPVFVFENNLGDGNEKYTAEAISHEVGHALGLNHDGRTSPSEEYYAGHGSGETGWAPVMGVGYYKSLTQWSRGEYAYAGNTEDDLSIITTKNGFGYRSDDHGDTFGSATSLTVGAGGEVSASGIIERNDDVDVFSFLTDTGSVQLDFLPAVRGPNLDIAASLYDAVGTLLVYSNPIGSLSASISATLAAGQYFVQLTGVGEGDPLNGGYSDYGSLGSYSVVGTVVESTAASLSIAATDADRLEGDSGSTEFTFAVTRSGNTSEAIDVSWAVTGSGTAPADAADFLGSVLPSGSVSFAAGETTKSIVISVAGDTDVEADESFSVALSNPTEGTLISQATATGTIRNDDAPLAPAGVTVSPSSGLTTSESGGSDQFSVVLDAAPTADVVIPVSSSDTSEGTVDKTQLTFTADNWNVPQVVTVTGVDDTVRDGNVKYVISIGPVQSLDTRYHGLDPDDVEVTNQDNDKPGNNGGGGSKDADGGPGNGKGPNKSSQSSGSVATEDDTVVKRDGSNRDRRGNAPPFSGELPLGAKIPTDVLDRFFAQLGSDH